MAAFRKTGKGKTLKAPKKPPMMPKKSWQRKKGLISAILLELGRKNAPKKIPIEPLFELYREEFGGVGLQPDETIARRRFFDFLRGVEGIEYNKEHIWLKKIELDREKLRELGPQQRDLVEKVASAKNHTLGIGALKKSFFAELNGLSGGQMKKQEMEGMFENAISRTLAGGDNGVLIAHRGPLGRAVLSINPDYILAEGEPQRKAVKAPNPKSRIVLDTQKLKGMKIGGGNRWLIGQIAAAPGMKIHINGLWHEVIKKMRQGANLQQARNDFENALDSLAKQGVIEKDRRKDGTFLLISANFTKKTR